MEKESTREEMLYKLHHFQQVLRLTYTDASEAYEIIEKKDGYSIALSYLTMSQQSYLELMRIYWEKSLEHHEIESFFTAYEDFIFQLKSVITDKDKNTSWLYSAHEKLSECWKSTDDFIKEWINGNIRNR